MSMAVASKMRQATIRSIRKLAFPVTGGKCGGFRHPAPPATDRKIAVCRRTSFLSAAPLLFARDAIVVAVHLDAGAIPQEVRGLGARSHLRAMRPSVAAIALAVGSLFRRRTPGGDVFRSVRIAECRSAGLRLGEPLPGADGYRYKKDKSFHRVMRSWVDGLPPGGAAPRTVAEGSGAERRCSASRFTSIEAHRIRTALRIADDDRSSEFVVPPLLPSVEGHPNDAEAEGNR